MIDRLAPLLATGRDQCYTPPIIIDRVIRVLGVIDLDPCSDNMAALAIPAARYYTELDDGLAQEWRGRVYMNPPYGRDIGRWIDKLITEHGAGRVPSAIALVPARTDTRWWKALRDFPVCLIRGRLRFSGQQNGAPFPSAVFALGCELRGFVAAFGDLGDIYQRIDRGRALGPGC